VSGAFKLLIVLPAEAARDGFSTLKWVICWAVGVAGCAGMIGMSWLCYSFATEPEATVLKAVRAAQAAERQAEAVAEEVGRWMQGVRRWLREEEPGREPEPDREDDGSRPWPIERSAESWLA
jgi:hypothetical protein